jgi:para-nitrobenzyl esterase
VVRAEGKDALNDPAKYNNVPTIFGTNKEENKVFLRSTYTPGTEAAYQAKALHEAESWRARGVDVPATAMSKNQPNVYAYQFNYGAYNKDGFNAWPAAVPTDVGGMTKTYNYAIMMGAAHSLEIAFFFGNWDYIVRPDLIFREDNKLGREALNEDMVTYLASFVRTGNPGAVRGVLWKPWSNDEGGLKRIIFDADATRSKIKMSNIIGYGSQEPQ